MNRCVIPYEFEGSIKNYMPDFIVNDADKSTVLYEIKPTVLTERSVMLAKVSVTKAWCDERELSFDVITEDDIECLEKTFTPASP